MLEVWAFPDPERSVELSIAVVVVAEMPHDYFSRVEVEGVGNQVA